MAPIRPLALLAGLALLPSVAHAQTIYHSDFESGVIDTGWSPNAHLDQGPNFTKFMGRYSENIGTILNNSVSLTLPPPGDEGTTTGGGGGGGAPQYVLDFDFYCIDSWDGNSTTLGPDLFEVYINSVNHFSYTFSNSAASQSYLIAPDVGPAYLGFNATDTDSIYRHIEIPFTVASGTGIVIKWRSNGLQGMSDESWGIDNVSVTAVPTPGSLALAGVGGLAFARRKRRA